MGRFLLLVGLMGTLLVGLFVPSVLAQEKMFIMPADTDSSWFIYELDPGEITSGTMMITNNSDHEQSVQILPVDAEATASGLFALKSTDSDQVGVGDWITVEDDMMTLDSRETALYSFEIEVPDDVPPGDYAGGLVMVPYENTIEAISGGAGFATVVNVGVRVYVTVSGDVVFDFDWTDYAHAMNDEGQHTFSYTFMNEGNVAVTSQGTMTLRSPLFEEKEIPLDLGVVYSGKSTEPLVTWKESFPFGPVTAVTTVDYARANSFGALADETIETMSGVVEREISFWVIPYNALLLAVFSFAVMFAYLSYRGRKMRLVMQACQPYVSQADESITTIATRLSVPWKPLAKINHLKFPFIVAKGQTIMAPSVHKKAPHEEQPVVQPEKKPLFPDLQNSQQ